MGRYIDGSYPEAEELLERLIGFALAKQTYTESHNFSKATGYQIRLRREPIEIFKAEGYLKYKRMEFESLLDIPLETINKMGRVLDIPPSIFRVPYDYVEITYSSGMEEIPEDIKEVVLEIVDLLKDEDINCWNLPLSPRTLETINRYKRQ